VQWTHTCAAVIPCFNEAPHIAGLVATVRAFVPTVLVVDDGSDDDTGPLAAQAGANVLRHPCNTGKGAALKTGLDQCAAAGFARAITLDGDGQHRPEDIPALLTCAEQTGARLVVGNRLHNARAIPWLRRQVNRWMSRRISRRAGVGLPDTQCGFRLVELAAWRTLRLRTSHFETESEMLLAFLAAGHRVEFVPIQVVGRGPRSHIHPLKDSWRWWRWWSSVCQHRASR
jgi:glycosyltransferase involved in cell wall biosynthesis